jgi:adenine-specific DNA-methyltransferase
VAKKNQTKLKRKSEKSKKKPIDQYQHKDKKRLNNPPVGLVDPQTDQLSGNKQYSYDPHLDPQLVWSGKAEHTSFEVPSVSLHVHERIDPRTIIEAVRKRNGKEPQLSLFQSKEENPPLRQAIEFYKHKHNWTNRLIAGDSLLVMNSLLEKEGLAGQVQMIYIDPPYGIKYGSNFQPFVNKRDVKDGKDADLTQEPEMIKAFRDTWENGIHSYLAYLRDRLLLARELLHESGSIFVQISDENLHHVRELMDETFGKDNFVGLVTVRKAAALGRIGLSGISDYLVWYSKSQKYVYHELFQKKEFGEDTRYAWVEFPNGQRIRYKERMELPSDSRFFVADKLSSAGLTPSCVYDYEFKGKIYKPAQNTSWRTNQQGMKKLEQMNRLFAPAETLNYVQYFEDFPVMKLNNVWMDLQGAGDKIYVVQTNIKIIQRCILMTTDPGDLVLDPTCGSGTTAYVAEQWGRRWITCDTSRVAITLAKQRLMTADYDYYELAHPQEGVVSGFRYKTVPHVTLKSIANNEPPGQETLYDQPFVDNSRIRVTGPFTVEAVPAQMVKPLSEIEPEEEQPSDLSIARSGETVRQAEWRDELLKSGIRGKAGQKILFSRVEPLGGTMHLQADGETKEEKPQRVVVSFGPEYAPLEQRQVALAIEEAQTLVPKPKIVVFATFQFDPEAAKDIDETKWPGVTLLKVQMNADLLTEDLKKKRSSNESFWLIGQPDVKLGKIKDGDDKGKYRVEVLGFDYYNTITGVVESGGTEKIAMWMLDTDYDGRSLFPRQVFFPISDEKEGWSLLAKTLKAEIDEELIEAYRGTVSLPFEFGDYKRIAVKIVDDRGIESLKIIEVKE